MKKTLMLCLSLLLCTGMMGQTKRTAMNELKELASHDKGKAQFILGMHYLDGDSIHKDYYMATHWFAQACKNGYEKGFGTFVRKTRKKGKGSPYYPYLSVLGGFMEYFSNRDQQRAEEIFLQAYQETGMLDFIFFYGCIAGSNSYSLSREEKEKIKESLLDDMPTVKVVIGELLLEERKDTVHGLPLLHEAEAAGCSFAHEILGKYYLHSKAPHYNGEKAVYHLLEAENSKTLRKTHWLVFCYEQEIGGLQKDGQRIKELRETEEDWEDEFQRFFTRVKENNWY